MISLLDSAFFQSGCDPVNDPVKFLEGQAPVPANKAYFVRIFSDGIFQHLHDMFRPVFENLTFKVRPLFFHNLPTHFAAQAFHLCSTFTPLEIMPCSVSSRNDWN